MVDVRGDVLWLPHYTTHSEKINEACKVNYTTLPIKWSLNYPTGKNTSIDKIVSDLFAFHCQKCSICKLKLYAGGEY